MKVIEMRKIVMISLAALFILNPAVLLFGEEPAAKPSAASDKPEERAEAKGDPLTKFGRGLCNFVTFYMEIPEQSKRVKTEHGECAAMTYGLGKGLFMAGARALVAVYEITTFFVPYPAGYKPILTDPVSFFPEPPKKKA